MITLAVAGFALTACAAVGPSRSPSLPSLIRTSLDAHRGFRVQSVACPAGPRGKGAVVHCSVTLRGGYKVGVRAIALGHGAFRILTSEILPDNVERALRAQAIVDETTAMAHAQPTLAAKRRAFDLTAVCLFTAWNAGTLVGALAGSGLRNPRDYGLDAVFPAVFLALLAPQLRGPDAMRAAVAGALIALALVPIAVGQAPEVGR
jgi:hypothetical protein